MNPWLLILLTSVTALIKVENVADSLLLDNGSDETSATANDVDQVSNNFIIFTVASDNNDPYQRYVRSLGVFGMDKYLQVGYRVSLYIGCK